MNSFKPIIAGCLAMILTSSCTVSRVYPRRYYEQNKELLHGTELLYAKATANRPLSIAYNDLDFTEVSLELKTDTVRYIYDFRIDEKRMNDTLRKFGYDSSLVQQIIRNMKGMRSTWINTIDHYVDGKRQTMLFISAPVKQFSIFPPMQKRKYYLFNFYKQPQYFDDRGRLLDKRTVRRLRKVNNEIFWRINDKVCYTISGKFR